jgi:hypothetical protein
MTRLLRRSALILCAIVAVIVVVWGPAYARGASFVIRAAQLEGVLLEAAKVDAQPFTIGEARPLKTRHGVIRSRLYRPDRHIRRVVVVVPGVHAMGIDEPRLRTFAGELAATGVAAVTIELPDLMQYRLDARVVDQIVDAVQWVRGQPAIGPVEKVGLMGISFAGGLAVVAAGRPDVRDHVAFVFSFGGHGDFPRALRYLCTGIEPIGPGDPPDAAARVRPPHDYGVAILLLDRAGDLVPEAQVEPLRQGILTFLQASQLDVVDKPRSAAVFAAARSAAESLPEPAATLMVYVNTRNVADLGARLLPVIERTSYPDALSPERSPAPSAPVFLLHGIDDTVIPSVETRLLAGYLEGRTDVRYLLSGLISHAAADRPPGPGEVLKLVAFWSDLLDE